MKSFVNSLLDRIVVSGHNITFMKKKLHPYFIFLDSSIILSILFSAEGLRPSQLIGLNLQIQSQHLQWSDVPDKPGYSHLRLHHHLMHNMRPSLLYHS